MTRLRQVSSPAHQANWTEHFYSGELKVVDGVVETDNPDWITVLKVRGFAEVSDEEYENFNFYGKEYVEAPLTPQGDQVVDFEQPQTLEAVEQSTKESENDVEEPAEEQKAGEDSLFDTLVGTPEETVKEEKKPARRKREKAVSEKEPTDELH